MDTELLQFVTWALVVVGWVIVNQTNNGRESRKEARSAVDGAKKSIGMVAADATEYFTGTDNDISIKVKSDIQMLELELERIKHFKEGSTLLARFVDFQEACTGGDFESATRAQHAKYSLVVQAIVRAQYRLVDELERQFRTIYC